MSVTARGWTVIDAAVATDTQLSIQTAADVAGEGMGHREPKPSAFLRVLESLGVQPKRLNLSKRSSGLFDRRCNDDSFFVSWSRTCQVCLFGHVLFSWNMRAMSTFDKYPAYRILAPLAGERVSLAVRQMPEVEEMAVFVERKEDPILAVRVGGDWYELYRWRSRQVVVLQDWDDWRETQETVSWTCREAGYHQDEPFLANTSPVAART